jgi:pyruvate, water dikinase
MTFTALHADALVPLEHALHTERFGGKATALGAALRGGMPVPPGFALATELVERIAVGEARAAETVLAAYAALGGGPVAVRSSAVGEDGASASFAGQHLTKLGVTTGSEVLSAIREVRESGHTEGARAYRARLGLDAEVRVGVVLQRLIDAECAGVMFTRCPLSGDDVRVIEAAWGLGETVVGGLVDPDRYRVERGGELAEQNVGEKDVAIRRLPAGHTEEVPVPGELRLVPCLDGARLRALDALATRCEDLFHGAAAHDIEWAFEGQRVYLLQRRAVTR